MTASACEGNTLWAVPPVIFVGATVVRTSAAASPPSRANTSALSQGHAASIR